jgi:hypothetical protein
LNIRFNFQIRLKIAHFQSTPELPILYTSYTIYIISYTFNIYSIFSKRHCINWYHWFQSMQLTRFDITPRICKKSQMASAVTLVGFENTWKNVKRCMQRSFHASLIMSHCHKSYTIYTCNLFYLSYQMNYWH